MNTIVQLASSSLRCERVADPSALIAGFWHEPLSHVNNALTMAQGDTQQLADLGVYLLQPGESFGANMRIESGPTP